MRVAQPSPQQGGVGGQAVLPHLRPRFRRVGGRILWRGAPECVLIGPSGEQWDIAFIAQYPNGGAFLEMVTDPAYQAVVYHRQAAVSDSRLIRMGEAAEGIGF